MANPKLPLNRRVPYSPSMSALLVQQLLPLLGSGSNIVFVMPALPPKAAFADKLFLSALCQ